MRLSRWLLPGGDRAQWELERMPAVECSPELDTTALPGPGFRRGAGNAKATAPPPPEAP